MTLSVAVAQPSCAPGDVAANAAAHAQAVLAARSRVVVFPELSLTGYLLDAPPVDLGAEALRPLVEACEEAGSVAFVGAPVAENRVERFIATLAVSGRGVVIAYRKMHLGEHERATFTAGAQEAVWEIDGWRLGLGICRDTAVTRHTDATAALGIDLFVAGLVHTPDELTEQDARGERIARHTGKPVAFATAAGRHGPGYEQSAGHSTIWSENGTVRARAGASAGDLATAVFGARER